jgi:2,3-bisphosphoglycerate-independent phosphoglycerate mutase
MHFLFLFMDGVGLGPNEPESNPLAKAKMPTLMKLLVGQRLVEETLGNSNDPVITEHATLLGLDASLGITGYPQSATGQATLLTGENIPAAIGAHFGPWPNTKIVNYLKRGTIFHNLKQRGYQAALLNAYPQSYFDGVKSGRRLPGTVAMSVMEARIPLKTTEDLVAGKALSADLTGEGWRNNLNIPETPVLTYFQAGERLALLTRQYDFAFFEYWISDYAGHEAEMENSCVLLETFDQMLDGLLSTWNLREDLILLTSDHGNMEDTNTRRHTRNLVPALIIGPPGLRHKFTDSLTDLTGIASAIMQFFE